MKITQLLTELNDREIFVSLDGDDLVINYEGDSIPDFLIDQLRNNKAELVSYLKRYADKEKVESIPLIEPQSGYELSLSQNRLYILSQFEDGSAAYNMPNAIPLEGQYDVEILKKAIYKVLERHEVLRTVFREETEGEVRQVVLSLSETGFSILQKDFSIENDSQSSAEAYVIQDAYVPFDLHSGPLLRVALLRLSNTDYILYYNMHHIISDGWSMDILTRDIMACYNHMANGIPLALPKLSVQYKDYAAWQLSQIKTAAFQSHRSFWLNTFSGELPILDLPGINQRLALKTYNGRILRTVFSKDETSAINRYVNSRSGTLFMFLMASLKALLYRYTGQEDIIIGTPVAGREHPELEDQIGFYLNILAVRSSIIGEVNFDTFFEKVKNHLSEAYEHQVYPFDLLVDDLRLTRDTSRSALFDILLVLQNTADFKEDVSISDKPSGKVEDLGEARAKQDITLNFIEVAGQLDLRLTYNTDVYSADIISRLIRHYQQFISAVIANSQFKIGEITYLSETEKNNILDKNQPRINTREDQTVVSWFNEKATLNPDKIALAFKENELTYKQLADKSDKLALLLRQNYRIEPNDLIAIMMPVSEWSVVALLAVHKAGAGYVPIDFETPSSRVNYLIEQTSVKCLVVLSDNLDEAKEFEVDKFAIDTAWDTAKNLENSTFLALPNPQDLAYVIFTSGSTGKPKGVMVTHLNIVDYVDGLYQHTAVSSCKSFALMSNLATDLGNTVLFGSLLSGGTLHLLAKDTLRSAEDVHQYFEEHIVDCIKIVPAHWNALTLDNYRLLPRKILIFGGDALPVSYAKAIWQQNPGIEVINHYGPTETTIGKLLHKVNPQQDYKSIPVGRPFSQTRVYVVDEHMNLCPIGVPGELLIGGKGVAKGYLNKPELTKKQFIQDPFVENGKVYRTGDLVKMLPDGEIEFIGRTDNQVKIRGHRIELSEIERVLSFKDGVDGVVVLAKSFSEGEKQLVAYYKSEKPQDTTDLRSYLQERLPAYMMPAYFTHLTEIPLTANGKINKKALPKPQASETSVESGYIAPKSDLEKKVCSLWEKVLNKRKVGLNDDFFAQGGHSIKAIKLISEYNKQLEVKLSINELFSNTTVTSHIALISSREKKGHVGIPAIAEATYYPISDAQRRLWVLSRFEDGSAAYNMPFAVHLSGNYSIDHFKQAIFSVLERHEILRTYFREDIEGDVYQVVLPVSNTGFKITYEDFRREADSEQSTMVYIQQDSFVSFDLERGPLLRVSLLQVADSEYILYYNMHHIVSDGWSMDILSRDILAYYHFHHTGEKLSLPKLRIQYKDYAAWQLAQLETEEFKQHKNYWLEKFSGAIPVLDLPGHKVRPTKRTYNGKQLHTILHKEDTQAIKQYVAEQSGTLFMFLLSSLKALFYKYTGQEDIIIGSPVAGRDHSELEDQIGFYVNTFALRSTLSDIMTFDKFYGQVKKNLSEGYEHQMYPFDRLLGDLKLTRNASRNPLYDIRIILQNASDDRNTELGEDIKAGQVYDIGETMAKFDILLIFSEKGDQLEMRLTYNTDVYESGMMNRLIIHYQQFVRDILKDSRREIGQLTYLSPEEKLEIIAKGTHSIADAEYSSVVEWFDSQAIENPNGIALAFAGKELTYQELHQRSTYLGAYLKNEFGIKGNHLLGIKMPVSEWSIVAILAVLKSGAGYVPVDPETPVQRIAYLMDQTHAKALIVSSESKEDLNNLSTRVLDIEEIYSQIDTSQALYKLKMPLSNHLAYVIFTSGSTGEPKGVMVTHANLIDYVQGLYFKTAINTCNSFALMSNIATDLGNTVLYGALLSGGTLHLLSKDILRSAEASNEYFTNNTIDCIKIVPAHWNALSLRGQLLLPAKIIVFGGDALPVSYVQAIRKHSPDLTIINHYGPTETTIGKLIHIVSGEEEIVPIGRPFSNTSVYVIDSQLNLCAPGVPGELLIGGKGVAKGYLNKQELTDKQFIQNPFSGKDKIYRTGDLVKMLPDGSIAFIGRTDNQVKIRGYRIELGEIEQILSFNEEVDATVIMLNSSETGDKELIAYIKSKSAIPVTELRGYLQERVPAHMIPSHFVHLEEFPLTPNGKIDRKALPDPEGADAVTEEIAFVAPASKREQALANVWQSVLKREKISVQDNFYDLGGDSIKGILIVSRMKKQGYKLRIADLMHTPVLSELATKLTEAEQAPVKVGVVSGEILLTPVQKNFLYSNDYATKSHYNQSVMLESSNPIDRNILEKSLRQLTDHHDALRIVFKNENGKWIQENKGISHKGYSLNVHDLTEVAEAEKEMGVLCDALQFGIDLQNGPLFKVGLFRLKEKDCLLLILHHIVVDGVSWRILLEDLGNTYQNLKDHKKVELPAKTDSFQQWAKDLAAYVSSKKLQSERIYWEEILSHNVTPLYKPKLVEGIVKGQNRFIQFTLDKGYVEKLHTKVHRVYNTEVNDVLLTALGLGILKVFGNNQVVVELEGHGREQITEKSDTTRTIGWFTSIYPFLLSLTGNSIDIHSALVQVKEGLRSIPNKGIGYSILKHLGSGFSNDLKPDILFNYLGDFGSDIPGTETEEQPMFTYSGEYKGEESAADNKHLSTKLKVSGMQVNNMLQMAITYNDALYEEQQIRGLSEAFKQALEHLINTLSSGNQAGLTPADLSYKGLTIHELEALNQGNNLIDVYKLSPLQEGLYYHWISEDNDATYVAQRSFRLRMLEVPIIAIRKSYEALVDRYTILRTRFTAAYGDLLQVVRKEVVETFIFDDISDLKKADVKELYIADFKTKDRARGFNPKQDSLMRLGVLGLGNGEFEFVWSYHHILMDGWCGSILINDFYQILMAMEGNQSVNLPSVTPYADYIKWLGARNKTLSLAYWEEHLAEYNQKATLPFKKSEIQADGYLAKEEELRIKTNDLDKLRKICAYHNITESTLIQSAWGYLLSKYNNTSDVVYGAVVSGRPSEIEGIENMVGLFINNIPVRVRYSGDMSVLDLLNKQKEATISGLEHHYISLSEVQSRSELGNELIDHVFVFENYAVNELDKEFEQNNSTDKLSLLSRDHYVETHYDFDILVAPGQDYLAIEFRYNGHVYKEEYIKNAVQHLKKVLIAFIDDPEAQLQHISYLSDSESTLIAASNHTVVDYPSDKIVLDLADEQAAKHASSVAVAFEGSSLTYGELNERVNQLADCLRHQYGVLPGDLIGIRLERSEWMLTSILAVMHSGAAYVPVDTDYPQDRIDFIAEDSSYKVCIDQDFLNAFDQQREHYSRSRPDVNVTGDTLAYGIYTSGSTGMPKGVVNSHEGLYNRLLWMRDDLGITHEDVILQKTPYTFDVSVWELIMPSITGSKLVFAKPGGHKDPFYLQSVIKESGVTIIHFVPSMLGLFLESLESPQTCRSLRHIVCSGEALPGSIVATLKQKLPWVRIHNLYGPTEAAIDVTSIELTDIDTITQGVTIGKPVANTRIYIVDQDLNQQAVGVPGELLIEGVQVARGYLNRPELNAEKFIDSPFTTGARAYRTGDLARWLPTGEIDYLGRIDHQVKIRGNRIELGEIESRLQSCGLVENAVVLVRDNNTHRYLVGYVVPKPEYTEEAIYAYMQEHLPDYMIPGRMVTMEAFPLTPSGKVNRKAFPETEESQISVQFVQPRTDVEKNLAAIWEDILQVESIGIHDNFFRVGGDSILSIRVISQINKQYDVNLDIALLYELSTIEKLSAVIEQDINTLRKEKDAKAGIEWNVNEVKTRVLSQMEYPETVEDIYPMRDIQIGMVLLSKINPEVGVYHDQFVYQIPNVDKALFEKAFAKIVQKHASLRTQFDLATYGEALQVVSKEVSYNIDYQDLNALGTKEKEAIIQEYMVSERSKPFRIGKGLLWRISLFEINEKAAILMFQFHHAILDGWSLATMNTELFQIYRKLENNTPANVPMLKATNRDAVIQELYDKRNEANIAFWQQELEGYRKLDIFKNEGDDQLVVKAYDFNFKYNLEKRCRQDDTTVKTVVYAAFVYALKALDYEDDFVVGMVSNNRPAIEDGDKLLGCFLNTIPIRNKLTGASSLTWSEYFKKTEENLLRIKQQERLTLYEITRATGEEAEERSPFFDVLFNYVNFHVYESLELDGDESYNESQTEQIDADSFELTNTSFDLIVNLTNNAMFLRYKLKRKFRDSISLEKIQSYVDVILHTYIEEANSEINNTDFLSTEDQQLIAASNHTVVDYPSDKIVLDLADEQAAKHASSVAVAFEGSSLTYGELNERVNQLADCLRHQYGVLPGDLIGIRLERSEWMLTSILAVMHSGAAYVPVDTDYPQDRIDFIAEDSSYKVCIDQDFLNAFDQQREHYSRSRPDVNVTGDTLAYGIYTSGSTGMPKGVVNSHEGLYNRLLWMRDDLGITHEDVILQKTPYTFDVSVWELIMPSITGSKLVFAKPGGHKDPFYLQSVIKESGVTIIHFVPSMLGLFLESLESPQTCRSLRHIVCSGEALPGSIVATLKQKLPWVRIHNLYGPTEAAIDVTSIELTDIDTITQGVTIGKPVANTRIYIVDQDLNQQAVGVPGELLIEGVQVARGYLNRPELNAEKFIDSPFTTGARAYRTGDLARWLPTGEIDYLGRIDHQVKIRGNRIELGEIESRLQSCGLVENAVVLVRDNNTHRYLVGYVVPKPEYTEEAIYAYMQEHLPDYMIPGRMVTMEAFPLTPSGKVNRKAFPETEESQISVQFVQPRTDVEKNLAAIWEDILQVESIGIHDNFFRVGGDSILSIRVISQINKQYDVNLDIALLYELSTIEKLSAVIEQDINTLRKEKDAKAGIEWNVNEVKTRVLSQMEYPETVEDIYPMRDIQIGMVLLSKINPEVGVYHDQFVYQIPNVDKALFEKAFAKIVQKHASLRTQFDLATYGEALQVVSKEVSYNIDYQDLNALGTKEKEAIIQEYMVSERSKPFRIGKGLLWRISLFEINEKAAILMFQFHHAILDGWSLATMNTELFQIYRKLENNTPANVPMLKATNRDAVIQELYDKRNEANIAFWQQELEGYRKLDIFKNEGDDQLVVKAYDFNFKYNLEKRCRQDDTTVKTVVYAAFVYALKALDYEDDFVVGMVSNNRPAIEDGDKLLGCFLNTIPIRNKLTGASSLTWSEYFKKTEENLLRIKQQERLTLYEITRATGEEAEERSPFFDVLFNYVNFHVYESLELDGDESYNESQTEQIDADSFELTNTSFDLIVNLTNNAMFLRYKLKRKFRDSISLEKIQSYVDVILHTYIEEANSEINNTDFLSTEDQQLIAASNHTVVDYPSDKIVLDLADEQAAKHASSVAVAFEGSSLTYGELNERVNQLADCLRHQYGVLPGDLIGIRLERSEWMLTSILAVMHSGAAYVPVDTDYPQDRIDFIAEDSSYKVCIDQDFLNAFDQQREHYSRSRPDVNVTGDTLAYGIYTSGSTGMPKGVVNSHEGLYNRLLWMRDDLGITHEDVILQKTPYTFDVSVWELIMPSITGSKLVFAKPGGHKDPFYLQSVIKESGVTIIHFVPSMLGLFLESLESPQTCRSLRHIVCSGEALPGSIVATLKQKLPWVRIHNLYGPTEAAIDVTSIELTDIDTITQGVTIGKPVANTRIYIVDQDLNQQAVGVPGELLIEGVQVARGYLNRPELNAEKFIDSPFTTGARAYRTGDLARWLPTGEIDYLGRIDHQVKIRGNRIELGEIESRLQSCGLVENAVVLVRDNNTHRYLVGYVVPKPEYTEEAIYAYMQEHLPDYMIPGRMVTMEAFPLTPSGKVNRKAFPETENGLRYREQYVAPADPVQEKVAAIWEALLEQEGIGIHNNFFRIGGDSLLLINLKHKLEQEFKTTINVVDLFNYRTIEEQARLFVNISQETEMSEIEELKF